MDFIRYERTLLKLIKERNPKERKLQNLIFQRIKGLYNQATVRFPNHKTLWDEFFVFTTSTISKSDYTEVSAVLDNTLLHHGHHVENWLKYIKWERAILTNDKKVKNLLLRALQRHPENEDLQIEFMDVELFNYRELPTENVIDNVKLLYNNARKSISSLIFKAAVLDKLSKYQFTKELQLIVLDDMKSMHCNEELFWHIIAQRELSGLLTFDADRNAELENIEPKNQSLKVNIKRCIKVYEAALSKVGENMC